MSESLPTRLLLDTNVLVYSTQGVPSAVTFLRQLEADQNIEVLLSAITEAELFSYSGLTPDDANRLEGLLTLGDVVAVDSDIARRAGAIRAEAKRDGRKVPKLPDALVAATALLGEAVLVTGLRRESPRL